MNKDMITETIVEYFSHLAQIPRPSHHEKKVSDFLFAWAKDHGFFPVQDNFNNVMFDVPATEGCGEKPLCILQAHMDMVMAIEDGKDFNPLSDPIYIVRDFKNNTLTADGTSLGSDDGAGVAIIMAIAAGELNHGPLRMIITADEEDGMSGTSNLDPAWLSGAGYLINIDSESSDEVFVSSASCTTMSVSGSPEHMVPSGDTALTIKLSGLLGGHSGMEINKGRLNGIIALAGFLKDLEMNHPTFELASFKGGSALNAIPSRAECTIVIQKDDLASVQAKADEYFSKLKQDYAGIENSINHTIEPEDHLPKVISAEDKNNIIRFLTGVLDGVYTWSSDIEGLVESSSNFGLFKLGPDGLSGGANVRSSLYDKEIEILNSQEELSSICGFESSSVKMANSWPYDPNSRLLKLARETYLKQNSKEIKISAIHAGLECGTFKLINPDLDMISIGPDIKGAHTVNETLYLGSIPRVWNLLTGILTAI